MRFNSLYCLTYNNVIFNSQQLKVIQWAVALYNSQLKTLKSKDLTLFIDSDIIIITVDFAIYFNFSSLLLLVQVDY